MKPKCACFQPAENGGTGRLQMDLLYAVARGVAESVDRAAEMLALCEQGQRALHAAVFCAMASHMSGDGPLPAQDDSEAEAKRVQEGIKKLAYNMTTVMEEALADADELGKSLTADMLKRFEL